MTIADLNAEVRSLCDADITSYPAADLLRRVNAAIETCVSKIIGVDGNFQYDDTNYTNLPQGTATLVSGQNSYSFTDKFLEIDEVQILDLNGRYIRITPFDPSQSDISFEEKFNIMTGGAQSGFPLYYDKLGDTIKLSAAPTAIYCTLTAGLRIRFKRTAQIFTTAEVGGATKEPGIASPYHQLLAYMAAIPYCAAYHPRKVPLYQKYVDELTTDMLRFYSHREQDARPIMTVKGIGHI